MRRQANMEVIFGADVIAGRPRIHQSHPLILLGGKACDGRDSAVQLGADDLGLHTLFIGPSGCGKTNCIGEALRQVRSSMTSKDSLLVFDPKGDYRPLAQTGDCMVSVQGSTEAWNIFGELSADGWDAENLLQNAHEIGETVFAGAISDSSQPFFPRAAKGIFCDVVATMSLLAADDLDFRRRKLNNECLADYLLNLDAVRLGSFLKPSPFRGSLKFVGDGTSDQALGVFAELQEVAGTLLLGDFGKQGALSVRRVQRSGGRALFVEYDLARMSSPTYAVLVDMFLKEALSRTGKAGSIFVFLDELPLVPHLQFLSNALTFGRSKGLKIIGGVQSVEQLYALYGEHEGNCLLSGFQNVFSFRSPDPSTRDYVSALLGECVKEVSYISPQTGKKESELRSGKTIEDADILKLRIGEALAIPPYADPYLFSFDFYGPNGGE